MEVLEAVLVGVKVGVFVFVGGAPFNINEPDPFHSVPIKIFTSYVPGSHFSTG